ncbi:hypothetical protein POM88_054060 [Heracleum sosnowskyi]|uniref:Uncharacterized protein n=1 Tax=Heracleum sosnowskyi TaxID=360622 RepID=A0AAD8GNX1_9APIA|nr:hypothetical protein POM88_054060 [Heracleum sosnowskyi]
MVECPFPVISTRYINISSPDSSFSASVLGKLYVYSYAYIVLGSVSLSKLEDNCRISNVVWVSRHSPFRLTAFSKFSEIHNAMIYGFHLHWTYFYCVKCDNSAHYCNVRALDHHFWACERYGSCPFYDLSDMCMREKWPGLVVYLKRKDIQKAIGKYAGIILAARFTLGITILLAVPFLYPQEDPTEINNSTHTGLNLLQAEE